MDRQNARPDGINESKSEQIHNDGNIPVQEGKNGGSGTFANSSCNERNEALPAAAAAISSSCDSPSMAISSNNHHSRLFVPEEGTGNYRESLLQDSKPPVCHLASDPTPTSAFSSHSAIGNNNKGQSFHATTTSNQFKHPLFSTANPMANTSHNKTSCNIYVNNQYARLSPTSSHSPSQLGQANITASAIATTTMQSPNRNQQTTIVPPASINIQQYPRGRQPYRSSSNNNNNNTNNNNNSNSNHHNHPDNNANNNNSNSVPLLFIHVPTNNSSAFHATKRTPSVPDLSSYYRHVRDEQHSTFPTTAYSASHAAHLTNNGDLRSSSSNTNNCYDPLNPLCLLSEAVLRNNERGNSKEHLQERLRRAELATFGDAVASSSYSARYRSRSTPSRGGMWIPGKNDGARGGKEDDRSSLMAVERERSGDGRANNQTMGHASGDGDLKQPEHHLRNVENEKGTRLNGFLKFSPVEQKPTHESSNDFASSTPVLPVAVGDITSSQIGSDFDVENVTSDLAADVEAHNRIRGHHSSVKSSDVSVGAGSRHSRTLSGTLDEDVMIPRPPPLPPPVTEKERLVERERQARLETERARRRHIAVLRERQLAENDYVDEDNEDAIFIGQISFDDGTNDLMNEHMNSVLAAEVAPSAPEFVGDNAVSALPDGNSSVAGSDNSIPRPPLPPPPATERERLVERERQARLETERARRRQALLRRERQEDDMDDCSTDLEGGSNRDGVEIGTSINRQDEIPSNSRVRDAVNEASPAGVQIADAEGGGLSYTMERFLETLGDEGRNEPLPNETAGENELSQVRMELFLAENVAVGSNNGGDVAVEATEINQDENIVSSEDNVTQPDSCVSNDHIDDCPMQPIDENLPHPSSRMNSVLEEGSPTENGCFNNVSTENLNSFEEAIRETIQSTVDVSEERIPISSMPSEVAAPTVENTNRMLAMLTQVSRATNLIIDGDDTARSSPAAHRLLQQQADSTTERHHNESLPVSQPIEVVASTAVGGNSDTERAMVQNIGSLSSRQSTAYSRDSTITNPAASRLTEEGIARLAEIENASIGNAPPHSDRDEPSEPSVIGRGAFLDHAFSVATQTTAIESVTEISADGRSESALSGINGSSESSNIIRVDSVVTRSSGAGSASIEAMPSSDSGSSTSVSIDVMPSSDESDNVSHLVSRQSSGDMSDSSSHSFDQSSRYSNEANSQMPLLTEADVETMAEIDNASLGNAPPHSVRDDRLSESSVIGRSNGYQIGGATPLADLESVMESSVDEHSLSRNLMVHDMLGLDLDDDNSLSDQSLEQRGGSVSVEVMPSEHSDQNLRFNSVNVMLSEHGDRSLHDGINSSDDEDMIVYQASDMASSTSIEALPSVDLEFENDDYGTIHVHNSPREHSAGHVAVTIDANIGQNAETTPLLASSHTNQESCATDVDTNMSMEKKMMDSDAIGRIVPLLIQLAAELPVIVFILEGDTMGLCAAVGGQKYQMVVASVVVMLSIFSQFGHESIAVYENMLADTEHTGQSHIRNTILDFSCVGPAISFMFGLIGFLCSGLDVVFGIVMACSIFTSFITSCVCGFLFLWFSRKFIPIDKEKWAIPLVAAFQDVIRCIVVLQVSRLLLSMTGSVVIDGDVCILG